jgi:ribosomal protein L40E
MMKAKANPDMIGLCLRCGARLTFCGKPFTAEIQCRSCFSINVYENSWQPVRLLGTSKAKEKE